MWVFSGSSITEVCGISRVMTQHRLLSLRCKCRAYILKVFYVTAKGKNSTKEKGAAHKAEPGSLPFKITLLY